MKTNIVHRSGNETKSGLLTLAPNSDVKLELKSNSLSADGNPVDSEIRNQLWFADKNNVRYAVLQANKIPDTGEIRFSLGVRAKEGNNFGLLLIRQLPNGTTYTGAPTPPSATDNSTSIATTAWVNNYLPAGSITMYGGNNIPTGWLLCDGRAVSRTTYARLFAAIGTAYGTGDGNTTFNLPNFTKRLPEGNGRGYINAGLPNITGQLKRMLSCTNSGGGTVIAGTGVFSQSTNNKVYKDATTNNNSNGWWSDDRSIDFNASKSNSIYGKSDTVQPDTCIVYFMIKY